MICCEIQITFVSRKAGLTFYFSVIKYILYESILTIDELRLSAELLKLEILELKSLFNASAENQMEFSIKKLLGYVNKKCQSVFYVRSKEF